MPVETARSFKERKKLKRVWGIKVDEIVYAQRDSAP
jgi:hypothetical protein